VLSSKLWRADFALAAAWALLRRLLYAASLVALVVLAGALSVAALPRLLGYGTLVVNGGSMSEAYPNGSLVIARWTAAEDVELGQVIVVQEETDDGPARPKIHRVVSLDEEGGHILAQTKGDANRTPDPKLYILPERVLTPVRSLPHLGFIAGFAATPLGWLVLVFLPASALCLATLRQIWKDDDQRRSRRAPPAGGRGLPPALPLLALMAGTLMLTAVVQVSAGLLIDTASVADNAFSTAAAF
jgi:signal peptidase I